MSCRRHIRSQLQPVRARDLLDGIRSGCTGGSASSLHPESCRRAVLARPCGPGCKEAERFDSDGMVWRAGATADVNCSLCQAGTYGTGSGSYAFHVVASSGRSLAIPSGVLVHESTSADLLTSYHILRLASAEGCHRSACLRHDTVCRRYCWSQLQPVPAGDLWDGIRSRRRHLDTWISMNRIS